jgi:hypothetical protein
MINLTKRGGFDDKANQLEGQEEIKRRAKQEGFAHEPT